jgi:hypothetical protein
MNLAAMLRAVPLLAIVVVLALPAATSSARTKSLYAWAFLREPPAGVSAERWHGPLVKHVRPGTYRINVKAQDIMPFHLVGPGVNRRTPRGSRRSTVYKTWTIRLRKGRYRYAAEGPGALEYAAARRRISGSFRVP